MTSLVRTIFFEFQTIFVDFLIFSRKIVNPLAGCAFEFDEGVL